MPAVSQKQRAFLNAKFGHEWTKRHHFANKGELPKYAHGKKTTSPETKTAFNKKKAKKKEKTEETTTSVNIGSQGTTGTTTRPKARLVPAKSYNPRPNPARPLLKKKKKKPAPSLRAPRSYTGREMADARDRVMKMVAEYETNRNRRKKRLSENASILELSRQQLNLVINALQAAQQVDLARQIQYHAKQDRLSEKGFILELPEQELTTMFDILQRAGKQKLVDLLRYQTRQDRGETDDTGYDAYDL